MRHSFLTLAKRQYFRTAGYYPASSLGQRLRIFWRWKISRLCTQGDLSKGLLHSLPQREDFFVRVYPPSNLRATVSRIILVGMLRRRVISACTSVPPTPAHRPRTGTPRQHIPAIAFWVPASPTRPGAPVLFLRPPFLAWRHDPVGSALPGDPHRNSQALYGISSDAGTCLCGRCVCARARIGGLCRGLLATDVCVYARDVRRARGTL